MVQVNTRTRCTVGIGVTSIPAIPQALRPRAYSYIRFSTPEQARGDSLRRQTERAAAWAAAQGLDLDQELTFRDLGVSAYSGKNAAVGQLSDFLRAVDDGRVPQGADSDLIRPGVPT